jgi:HEAT repeat protein
MRKAGCAVLGVIAEGCSDRIRESLDQILPRLLQLVQDPEFYVRECACFALGTYLFHVRVIPVKCV